MIVLVHPEPFDYILYVDTDRFPVTDIKITDEHIDLIFKLENPHRRYHTARVECNGEVLSDREITPYLKADCLCYRLKRS